jgi:branched-subunit amino acid transport protein
MTDLVVVGLAGLGSYVLRVSFIAVAAGRQVPPLLERLLSQIKPAALTALAVTALASHQAIDLQHLGAVAVAAVAARRGVGLTGVLLMGMATLAALSLL